MKGSRPTRRRRFAGARIMLLGIAAALAAGVALAGSASAAWLPAKTVATGPVFTSDVAVSPDGVATVVWGYEGEPGVHARRFGPGGAPLGPSFQIGDGDEIDAVVAEPAADGSVVVAWGDGYLEGPRTLSARRIDPSGEPAPVTHSIATDLSEFDLAVAPDGKATIVWSDQSVFPARIAVRQIGPDDTLTNKEFISPLGDSASTPVAAVAPGGEAAGVVTVGFIQFNGFGYTVYVRQIDADGDLHATAHAISPPPLNGDDSGFGPSVGVDAAGVATIVWQQQETGATWIRARRLPPGASPGEPVDISPSTGRARRETALAVTPTGDAVIGWAAELDSEPEDIVVPRARVWESDGALGDTFELGGEDTELVEEGWMDIAVTGEESAAFVWELDRAVWGRELVDGELGPRRELGPDGSEQPSVAAGPDGVATATWLQFDEDDNGTLRIARSDPGAKARVVAKATARKRVRKGQKLTVKVRVRNRGAVPAGKVRVCPKLPKKSKRAFKPLGGAKGCRQAGGIGAGKAKTVRLRLKAKRKLRPGARYKLGVVVTGRSADGTHLPKRSAAVRVRGAR